MRDGCIQIYNEQHFLQNRWGNEISYRVSEDGIIACMTAGPNKIREFGKGDDLVVDTNMSLSKVLSLPDPPTDSTSATPPTPSVVRLVILMPR